MSGIGSRVLLALDVQANDNATATLNRVDDAMRRVNANLKTSATAHSQLGRTVSYSSALQAKGMRDAAQATFRYTFYALMALRAGQAIASRVYIKGLSRTAEEYESAWTRIRATLQVSKSELVEMQDIAFQMTRTMPFLEKDVGGAILEMARAGMRLADIKKSIVEVGRAAMVAEVGLADAGIWLVQMLNAYSIKAEKANEVTSLLAYYSNEATYSAKALMDILAGVGGSAAAFGQNIAQVMQLATAFGKMGTAAGEADTLIRQLYMNASKPDVYEAMKYGLDFMGFKPMYDDYGNMSNLGEAFLGFSKFLDEMLNSTAVGEERAAMAAKINEAVYTMFGVRSSRAFFQIAKMDPEAFRSLYTDYNDMVAKATEYTDKYIAEVEQGYQYSKQMAAVAKETFLRQLGMPMLTIMRPLNQLTTQFAMFGSEMLSSESGAARLVPMFLLLTTSAIGLAGAVGIAAGSYLLLKMRMADVGQGLLSEPGDWVGHLRGKGFLRGVAKPSTAQIGFAYFKSIAAGPLKFLTSSLVLGGAAYLAYKRNLFGFQELGKKMSEWWKKNMTGPQTIAIRLAQKLKEASTYNGQGKSSWFAVLLKGIKDWFSPNSLFGYALKSLGTVAKWTGYAIVHFVINPLVFVAKVLGKMFGWMIRWFPGLGDQEKGIERLGQAIGALVGVLLIDRTIAAVRNFGSAIKSLVLWMTVGRKLESGGRSFGLYNALTRRLAPATSQGFGAVWRGGVRTGRRVGNFFRSPMDEALAATEIQRIAVPSAVVNKYARLGVGGQMWAPRDFMQKGGRVVPVPGSPNVMLRDAGWMAYAGRSNDRALRKAVTEALYSDPGKLTAITANRVGAARLGMASDLAMGTWRRRSLAVNDYIVGRGQAAWGAGSMWASRMAHPLDTARSAWGTRRYGLNAGANAAYAGAIGRVGSVGVGGMLSVIVPYLVAAGIVAAIIVAIVNAMNSRTGGGTTNNINVTVAQTNATPEDIASTIAATLTARERSKEIATVESNARNGYLQTEMEAA